jgi:hypothetical protein
MLVNDKGPCDEVALDHFHVRRTDEFFTTNGPLH